MTDAPNDRPPAPPGMPASAKPRRGRGDARPPWRSILPSWGTPWLKPAAVLVTGLALSAVAAWWVSHQYERERTAVFDDEVAHAVAHVERELQDGRSCIDAVSAALQLAGAPSDAAFDQLAERLTHSRTFLSGVAWIPIIDRAEVPALEAALKARAGGNAGVWSPPAPADAARMPSGDAGSLAPMAMVYPASLHAPVHGLDLLAGPVHSPALREALKSGKTVAIGPVSLAWMPGTPTGVLILSPFAAPAPGSTPRGAAAGFLLLDEISEHHLTDSAVRGMPVRLELGGPRANLPAFPARGVVDASARAVPPAAPAARLIREEQVEIGGLLLPVRAIGDESVAFAGAGPIRWGVLVAGALLAFACAASVGSRGRVAARLRQQRRELERANASLRDSEERHRLANQVIAGIVYDWLPKEDRVTRSGGLTSILGYEPDEVPPGLRGWMSLIHPDDLPFAAARFEAATQSSDDFGVEYRVRHKAGHYIDVLDRCVILHDPSGEPRRVVGCTVSLAAQRSAEQAAREANARFTLFADAINEVLWSLELNPFSVGYLNAAFERVWGMPRERVYREPEAWLIAIHPEDRERVAAASRVWVTPDAPRTRRIDYRISRADGQVRWVQDTAVRLDDPSGRPVRVVGVVEDITDRKLAQMALQQSENDYRQLFDANVTASVVFDPSNCRIVQVNAAAATLYGYPVERLCTMSIFDLCAGGHEELREQLANSPTPPARFESCHRLASGELRDVEIFSSAIHRAGRRLVYSLIHDISERKRIEAALEESRRTFDQAQSVGRIGSWASDASPEGRLVWSSQVYSIFGVDPERFDQRISSFYTYVHPADLEMVKSGVAAAIRDGTVYRIDHRIIRPDGEVRWVLEQGEVEYGPGGEPRRVVGVVQDITERRAAEQALRDNQERLRTTLDSLAEGCLVHAMDGAIVECNHAAELILGMPRDALLRRSSNDRGWTTIREDGTPMPPEEYAPNISLATGREVDGVVVGVQIPTGALRWLSINARPLRTAAGAQVGAVISISDVSERRAAAMALQHTARRYQLLFESNPEPLWVFDVETLRFLAVNSAAIESYGYSREEFLSMTLLDIRPEDQRGRVLEYAAERTLDSPAQGVWVHRTKDGRIIDVEIIANSIEFEGRKARIVLAKDITERIRSERALRESEARLREAQRIGSVGDWEYDLLSGRITWSDEVFRLYRRDTALGAPSYEENLALYPPGEGARLDRAVRESIDLGRDSQIDLRVVFPDGTRVWHRGIIRAIRDQAGRVVRLRGVVQDITERKHAEDALRSTQLRLAVILEHLPDVVVYESDGAHVAASDNILALTGFPADVFRSDRGAFLRLVHPDDLADAEKKIDRLFRCSNPETLNLQYRLRHRDGRYLWIEDRMVCANAADEHPRILGVLIDITERKRSEQRQRLMMAELDHRVKNNLATVISLLEQTGRTSSSQQEFHHTILGRLQALARMHKALSRTHWAGVALHALVSQTLEAYRASDPARVQIVGEDLTLPARAASPLAMALHELATNAAKYGALSVPQGRVRVEWSVASDPQNARHLTLVWTESGGPPVTPPHQNGFGTELIQGGIAYELHGEARIEFLPAGVRCTMHIPLVDTQPVSLPLPDLL
jgi:PAS domain S-box-containing protein